MLFLALSLVISGPGRGWISPLKIMLRSEGLKLAGLLVEYGTLAFENLLRMCQVSAPGRVNERVSDIPSPTMLVEIGLEPVKPRILQTIPLKI